MPAASAMADLVRLLLLQVMLATYRLWSLPGSPASLFLVPMAEVLAIVGAFKLADGFRAARKWDGGHTYSTALQALLLSPVFALLLTYNAGEAFYRRFYLQHFNPFTDLALVPGFARMLFPSLGIPDAALGIVSVTVCALVVCALSFGLIVALARIRTRRPAKYSIVRGAAIMALAAALLLAMPAQSPLLSMLKDARSYVSVKEGIRQKDAPDRDSRGSTTLDTTPLAGNEGAPQNNAAWVFPGIQDARMLELMGNAGYRRIYAAPGTRNAPEAWRLAYPFDEYLLRYDFGYEGPFVSFGAMPDQYLLNRVAEGSLRPGEKDFALYLLVSSHVPFELIPVYQAQWSFPLRGKEYDTALLQRFDNDWLGGNELARGYLAGIEYSLRSAVGLFTGKLEGLNVGLILGDHQARKPVSHQAADYQVPFHLVIPRELSRAALSPGLPEWKLSPGFEPGPDPEAPGMESLLDLLSAVLIPGE